MIKHHHQSWTNIKHHLFKDAARDLNTDLYHGVPHKIVFKPFQLKLQNRREINEQYTFLSILKQSKTFKAITTGWTKKEIQSLHSIAWKKKRDEKEGQHSDLESENKKSSSLENPIPPHFPPCQAHLKILPCWNLAWPRASQDLCYKDFWNIILKMYRNRIPCWILQNATGLFSYKNKHSFMIANYRYFFFFFSFDIKIR